MAFRRVFLFSALLLAACGASAPSDAEAQDQPISQEEFDRMLRDALMRNPEYILLAIENYRMELEQEANSAQREGIAEFLPELVSAKSGHAIGASEDDAELVVVEFFDYHCGFCKDAMGDVMELVEADPSVRVVFQELPILRDESRDAAVYAIAAAKLNSENYGKVHQALLASNGLLDGPTIDKAIKRAGLRPKAVKDAAAESSEEINATIDRSIEIARTLGINGTPFFVVANPETGAYSILNGYRSEEFVAAIEQARG